MKEKLQLIETEHKDWSIQKIRKSLGNNHSCYVLITCKDAVKDGRMDVEMSYEGDEMLAAYLLDSAAEVFNSSREEEPPLPE